MNETAATAIALLALLGFAVTGVIILWGMLKKQDRKANIELQATCNRIDFVSRQLNDRIKVTERTVMAIQSNGIDRHNIAINKLKKGMGGLYKEHENQKHLVGAANVAASSALGELSTAAKHMLDISKRTDGLEKNSERLTLAEQSIDSTNRFAHNINTKFSELIIALAKAGVIEVDETTQATHVAWLIQWLESIKKSSQEPQPRYRPAPKRFPSPAKIRSAAVSDAKPATKKSATKKGAAR